MNQIVEMFRESNSRMRLLMGKDAVDWTRIAAAQKEFEGQIRLANVIINAYAVDSKNKRSMMKALDRMNLMDDRTAIDVGILPDSEKVRCLTQGRIVTRGECLDFSGEAKNLLACKDCPAFGETREMIMGAKE